MNTHMILNHSDLLGMNQNDPGYKAFCRGWYYLIHMDYNQAIRCFNHARRAVPNFAVAYDYLSMTYSEIGDYASAWQMFFYAAECRAKRVNKTH